MLTEKQKAFFAAYTAGDTAGNATASARAAGYAGSANTLAVQGSQLLRHPQIASALALRAKAIEHSGIMDATQRRRAMQSYVDDPGESSAVRLKALEMLCKVSGDFIERREVSGPSGAPIPIVHLTIESAEALAEKGLKHG